MATMASDPAEAVRAAGIADDRLPTLDELNLIERTLHNVQEFMTEQVFRAVQQVCEAGEPRSVTYEQIGQLMCSAQTLRDRLQDIESDLAAITVMAFQSATVAEGYSGDGTPYMRGSSRLLAWPDEMVASRARTLGFGDVA